MTTCIIVLLACFVTQSECPAQNIGSAHPDVGDDTAPYAQARRLLKESQYQAALEKCDEALKEQWPPRYTNTIQATAARCCLGLHRRDAALVRLESIYQRNASSSHLTLLPLVWDERLPDSERLTMDPRDLQSESVPRRLCAASALLHRSEYRDECAAILKQLRTSGRLPLSILAETQSWRLLISDREAESVTLSTITRWQGRVSELPEPIQAGPHFVVARGLRTRRRLEQAALEFLWAPYMQCEDPFLAASSLFEAADCLQKAGQLPASRQLFGELKRRFADASVTIKVTKAETQETSEPKSHDPSRREGLERSNQ